MRVKLDDDALFDWKPMKFAKGRGNNMIMTFYKEHDDTGK